MLFNVHVSCSSSLAKCPFRFSDQFSVGLFIEFCFVFAVELRVPHMFSIFDIAFAFSVKFKKSLSRHQGTSCFLLGV